MVERFVSNEEAVGSMPTFSTFSNSYLIDLNATSTRQPSKADNSRSSYSAEHVRLT